jgi:hypothetical protein
MKVCIVRPIVAEFNLCPLDITSVTENLDENLDGSIVGDDNIVALQSQFGVQKIGTYVIDADCDIGQTRSLVCDSAVDDCSILQLYAIIVGILRSQSDKVIFPNRICHKILFLEI